MKPLRLDTVIGARQPFPSMTAAMAATWARMGLGVLWVRLQVANVDELIERSAQVR